MGGYVTLPAVWRSTPDKAKEWIDKSLDHVGALPPKKKAAKKSK